MVSSEFIHVAYDKISFFFKTSMPLCVCICTYIYIFFILSFVSGHLGCFYFVAIVFNAAMNMGMQISLCDPVGYITRGGIAGSYGNDIFNFLRKLLTIFHSSYTI